MRVMDNLGPDTSINTLICSYYLHSTLHCLVLNPSNTEKLIQVASMNNNCAAISSIYFKFLSHSA